MSARTARIVACASALLATTFAAAAAVPVEQVLRKTDCDAGVCVVLGDADCRLAAALARRSRMLILLVPGDEAAVEKACRAADRAGLYGTRVFVARGGPERIGLADDYADLLVAAEGAGKTPRAEVLRVLRPGGRALLGPEEITKPAPRGADAWSHHYHGPDNNPQSEDRLARAPYLTQFLAEPRYGPAPQAAVAAGGRVFMAFGNVAWHQREERWMNRLVAISGYNGAMLWTRPLPEGIMVDRSTMIATPETLYLADGNSCRLLDPATGRVRDEIVAPEDTAGGRFWKWMALADGRLYALVGRPDPPDANARWRRRAHGWPWSGISRGYNAQQYPWGMAGTLLAIDPTTKKVLWRYCPGQPIDSRMLCTRGGRIFAGAFGRHLAALDARTGKVLWRRDARAEPDYFKALGRFSPGHGYRTGWKSTAYARCTEKALYLMGPQLDQLTAISAADGYVMWSLPAKINVHVVIRPDGLYTIGGQNTKGETRKLDPLTGKVLATFDLWRRACTRATGTADGIFCRAPGGTVRLDVATGRPQWISPMRPSCQVGVIVAHGRLYWLPWVCDCNLQMFGAISVGPAGDFDFRAAGDEKARTTLLEPRSMAERRRKPAASDRPGRVSDRRPGRGAPGWTTYLGDNARSAQQRWPALYVPDRAAILWQATPARAFEPTAPVVAGALAYVGGRDGIVRALRLGDGKEAWRAYTGGAIFYPPTIAADGRALVGSADGYVYAFDAADGRCLWRFRAAPAERRISVFGRLQSTWPVAGGVLVEQGPATGRKEPVAYFAAGLTDYDGTHVFAVDARTGALIWHNGDSGHLDAFSRRGVAVQGHLLAAAGRLYLAGGNCVSPAMYDMKTGKCLNAPPQGFGTRAPRGRELRLAAGGVRVSGQPLYSDPACPVYDASTRWEPQVIVGGNANLMLLPGRGAGGKKPWRLLATDPYEQSELWTLPLPAEPVRWGIAAAGRRIVVTCRDGRVLCIGPKPSPPAGKVGAANR